MGAILSCCREHDDENEALLASQQNGYGADQNGQDYNALQRQMKEHEEQVRVRENLLKDIVASTNDKLIDISMISNSGIVVQGSDLKSSESEYAPEDLSTNCNDTVGHEGRQDLGGKSKYVVLDAETAMSDDMRRQLRMLHETIFETLEEELRVEAPGKLIVTLK